LLVLRIILSITNEATLVGLSTVVVEFIAAVEPLPTEPTLWMPLEATLISGAWHIIALSLMLLQLLMSEEGMLMCKNFLIPSTQTAVRNSD